jgi:hypothetical protein
VAKVIAAVAVVVALPLLVILLVAASPAQQAPADPGPGSAAAALGGAPAATARAGIPAAYLAWYMNAAPTCPGLPWPVLAGIGTVESGNGQSGLPGVHSGVNYAGAEGPMQFEPATFARYATGPDQPLSIYDPADAIYTAAAMLCATGARGGSTAGIEQAIFAYNYAGWYVSDVMSWAARYASGGNSPSACCAQPTPAAPRLTPATP